MWVSEHNEQIEVAATVCSNCFSEECWKGNFFCEEYKTAGIVHIGIDKDGLYYFYDEQINRIPKLGRFSTLKEALAANSFN